MIDVDTKILQLHSTFTSKSP